MGDLQIKRCIDAGKLGVEIIIKYKNLEADEISIEDIESVSILEDNLRNVIAEHKAENGW